ncbi:MAG: AraC family transcriptional regulator [Atopobiaceae bacterium]
MDPHELDAWLRHHTESEERYLADDRNYLRERLQKIGIEEKGALKVPMSPFLFDQGHRFAFKKHSRFNDYPEHIHDWVELEYMYAGSCVQRLNGMPIEVEEGEALLVDQNTRHKVPELSEDQILLNLVFGPETIPSLLEQLHGGTSVVSDFLANSMSDTARKDSYILFKSQGSWRLRALVQLFCCDFLEGGAYLDERLTPIFQLIMMELIHFCQEGQSSASLEESRQISVLPALQAIEERYADITLEEVASEMGVSPAYLSRLLKKQTGSSFQRLLVRQRMSEAARLLSFGTLSVTEVARRVGYTNVTFFYRKFQEEFGCSPGEWRTQKHAL